MIKHIISSKKTFKLPIMLVALLGVFGAFSNVNARTQYLISSGAPACGSCHLTDPVKGLIIEQTHQGAGVLGPVWFDFRKYPDFSINDKMTQFCQWKLHDKTKTATFFKKSSASSETGYLIVCVHGTSATQSVQAMAISSGAVTESDSLGTKKSANGATDIWAVTCPVNTVQLTVSVRDNVPNNPALVGIQIKKGDAASTTSIDTSESNPSFSQDVTLAAGEGVYDVLVNKTAVSKVGIEKYTAKFSCTDIDSNLLDITAIEKIQDQ